jgi:putative transposase
VFEENNKQRILLINIGRSTTSKECTARPIIIFLNHISQKPKSKHCGIRATILAMVLTLMETAQKRWHRLRGYNLLADVITGVKCSDGIKQQPQEKEAA